MDKLSTKELWQLKHNFSSARESSEEHFFRCWNHQDCKVCLAENECSWCPMTSACVPNSYAIPLLAPAYDENICPHWAERWELRTKPLGCQVSTITSLTSIISIVSTFIVVLTRTGGGCGSVTGAEYNFGNDRKDRTANATHYWVKRKAREIARSEKQELPQGFTPAVPMTTW
ncbi:hypothetical protein BDP67DRAFT_583090 [Colletotrichum lupini]|nr:hypothetical protein BDP67DRAFT_583090 [Colletotrichum lupini]